MLPQSGNYREFYKQMFVPPLFGLGNFEVKESKESANILANLTFFQLRKDLHLIKSIAGKGR